MAEHTKAGRPAGKRLEHTVTIRLDDDLYQSLLTVAGQEDRPITNVVRIAIRQFIGGK